MNTLEEKIRRGLLYLQTQPVGKWSGTNPSFEDWYDQTHAHLQNILLPTLKATNERLAQYYPVLFSWGNRVEQSQHIIYRGMFATGYLCISDQSIYIVTFKSLTERFPLQAIGTTGYGMRILGAFLNGRVNRRMPSLEDKVRRIPFRTVLGAEITIDYFNSEALFIRTANETWQIHEHFTDTLEEISVAVNMGCTGALAAI